MEMCLVFLILLCASLLGLPPPVVSSSRSLARTLNLNSLLLKPRCGIELSLFDGNATDNKQLNLLVHIGSKLAKNVHDEIYCDGIMISDSLVLTTAKCVDKIKYSHKYIVFSPSYRSKEQSDLKSHISWTCKHPKYNAKKGNFNQAIIVLDSPFRHNLPSEVCLWNPSSALSRKRALSSLPTERYYSPTTYGVKNDSNSDLSWIEMTRTIGKCLPSKDQAQFCVQSNCNESSKTRFSHLGGSPIFVQLTSTDNEVSIEGDEIGVKRINSRFYLIGMTQDRVDRNSINECDVFSATDLPLLYRSGQMRKLLNHCLQSRR